jgi:hypothetical protein
MNHNSGDMPGITGCVNSVLRFSVELGSSYAVRLGVTGLSQESYVTFPYSVLQFLSQL